jgi:hypothetical protein
MDGAAQTGATIAFATPRARALETAIEALPQGSVRCLAETLHSPQAL